MKTKIKEVKKNSSTSLVTTLKFPSTAVAEVKPSYRRKKTLKITKDNLIITSSYDAYEIFKSIWNHNMIDYCEEVYALFLDGQNVVHAYARIAEGSINHCYVYIQKVLTLALVTNSASFIFAHNHPSGKLEASEADKIMTKNAVLAARLVGLKLLDHLILSSCPGGLRSIYEDFPELFKSSNFSNYI